MNIREEYDETFWNIWRNKFFETKPMSEEIIGPGDPCPYCGEVYGQHVARCPKVVQDAIYKFSPCSPSVLRMQQALDYLESHQGDEAAIDLLKQAIMHQRINEDVAEIERTTPPRKL